MSATSCADSLADYVINTGLDGVDIDWEETAAFQNTAMNGEQWLIDLTNRLRTKLPNHIITHAPKLHILWAPHTTQTMAISRSIKKSAPRFNSIMFNFTIKEAPPITLQLAFSTLLKDGAQEQLSIKYMPRESLLI